MKKFFIWSKGGGGGLRLYKGGTKWRRGGLNYTNYFIHKNISQQNFYMHIYKLTRFLLTSAVVWIENWV